MPQDIDLVKTEMHKEFTKKKQPPIYEPDMFQRFCVLAGATKLFDTILNSITSQRLSSERNAVNKTRVSVAFIYRHAMHFKLIMHFTCEEAISTKKQLKLNIYLVMPVHEEL